MLGQDSSGYGDSVGQSAILATKLYRPTVAAELEPRSDLVSRLEHNSHRALTLISAPAGYGKSTLAGVWFDQSATPGCWVSLDEDDDDLHIFLAYVVAAIHSIAPDVLLHTQSLLEAPVLLPPEAVARILLNDLEQMPRRILLVLDDLQTIRSQPIHVILAKLLRHPSPKLHLVLISRRDPPLPLPFLRAHNQITEIRTRDLRFSTIETAGFLAKTLNREIDDATAEAWTKHTEGWVTALSLAAIALRQREEGDAQPHDGPIDSRHLQEYLLVEIFQRMDPQLREWLLTIARLDRFCPALCTAVCGADSAAAQTDLTGEAFIQRLQDENLFLISLDRKHQWFRLHDLFRELLQGWGRNHYDADDIAASHRRAGAWFAANALPDEAIRHLVLGSDIAEAQKVVLRHRYDLMNSEQWIRLKRWLSQFPDSVVTSSAMLMSTAAFTSLHIGEPDKVNPARLQAELLLAEQGPKLGEYNALLGEMLTLKALRAIGIGDHATLEVSTQRALQLLPADAILVRAIVCGEVAASLQMRGRFADSCRLLEESMGDPQWTPRIRAQIMVYQCLVSFMQGDLTTTQAWAERLARTAERRHLTDPLCIARHYLGVVHYLREEFGTAEPYLTALVETNVGTQQSHMYMGGFALALIYERWGDSKSADAVIERLVTYCQAGDDAFASEMIEAFKVELTLRRGDLDTARRLQIGLSFDNRSILWFFYLPQLTPIKLLLAEGTPEALDGARADLEEFEEQMRRINRNLARIDGLILLALVCEAQGDAVSADTHLTTALLFAQGTRLVRPFADFGLPMAKLLERLRNHAGTLSEATLGFVDQILVALPPSSPIHAVPVSSEPTVQTWSRATLPLEPLTKREQQVLHQLAADLTPDEIAARHVVSVMTVRSQIKSIYRKLNVHSRRDAIQYARELNIIH